MELISIIVPVYKVEKYLKRCILSITNQTYENLEIILVDDGSPDNCPLICDEMAEKDERIKVIHQENKGLSGARNAGIDIAKGEYIAFVDSDDFIAEDFIEVLYNACISTQSDIAQSKYEYVTKDELLHSKEEGQLYTYSGIEMIENMYIPDGAYFVVAWNKLYKASLFENIRYPLGRIHEDEATTHLLYYKAQRAVFVDRFLYGYFTAEESITRNAFNKKRLDWEWAVNNRLDFLKEKNLYKIYIKAVKAYADGVIDLYYQCRESLKDSDMEQKELKRKIKKRVKECKIYRKYEKLPLSTYIGYKIFDISPMLYKKLLNMRL